MRLSFNPPCGARPNPSRAVPRIQEARPLGAGPGEDAQTPPPRDRRVSYRNRRSRTMISGSWMYVLSPTVSAMSYL
jgi:hypothetical protein